MNHPSKHAIPYLPHGTGATAPTSFAGTLDFLLSKNRDQPPELEGKFLMEKICPFFVRLPWTFGRGLWSCLMVLYEIDNAFANR